jgi:alpha-L-fucosidase
MRILISVLIVSITYTNASAQAGAYTNEAPEQKAERMSWYSEARFGMFLHWGAYSILDGEYHGKKQKDPKGEWIMNHLKIPVEEYRDSVVSKFNPVDFNADEWVRMAKNAGMKYIVMTTKHHDGFALFDSEVSDYNIVDATPFKRDVIKELSDACHKHGLKFGIYYSQAQDWYHPGGYRPDSRWDEKQNGDWSNYFRTIVKGQVTELLTNYGEVSLLWWDSGRAVQDQKVADEVGSELVKLQPNIIVNPRLGGKLKGDFQTHEQVIPAVFTHNYNELCLTHNRSWSFKKSDTTWKSSEFMLKTLVQMASQGANFLFNVGPDPLGNFPEASIQTLKFIGDWMDKFGESIYGTTKSPFYKLDWGYATVKSADFKNYLYLHVTNWPENGEIFVPGLLNDINQIRLLGSNQVISTVKSDGGIFIKNLPKNAPHSTISVLKMELIEDLNVVSGYIQTEADNSIILKPTEVLFTIKPQFDFIPQISGSDGEEFIDMWKNKYPHPRFKNTGNKAHWIVEVPEKGNFKAMAIVSTESDNNMVRLIAKTSLSKQLLNTGGMGNFATVDLGEISLSKGVNTITFTGGKRNEVWDYVRLKQIKLIPVN